MNNYTYEIKPFQKRVIDEIGTLKFPTYNIVMNQQIDRPNLTLKQMKRSIYRSVSNYLKDLLGIKYISKDYEKEYLRYYCFFETSGYFHKNQMEKTCESMNVSLGLHFHLFISPLNKNIHMDSYIFYLYDELSSYPNKKTCINKYDYKLYNNIPIDFILYHTKQYSDYPREMIFKNF